MEKLKDCLEDLDYLEEQSSCTAYVKGQIKTLKIDLKFLRTFLMCKQACRIDGLDLINGFRKIEAVIQDVESVILTLKDVKEGTDMKGELSCLIQKIELTKPEICEYYQEDTLRLAIVLKKVDPMVNLVDYALENLIDLLEAEVNSIAGQREIINTLSRRLRFLRNSLQFADQVKILKYDSSLFHELGRVAIGAAFFFLSCWVNKNEPQKEPQLPHDLKYTTSEQATCLYRCISKAFHWEALGAADAFLLGLIDFLLEQLAEILHLYDSLEIPAKNQFESIADGLRQGRYLLSTTSNPHASLERTYRQFLRADLDEVVRLIEFHVANMNDEMMAILVQLQERLKLIHIFFAVNRGNETTALIAPVKDQLETLCEDIQLLRTFYYDTQKGNDEDAKFQDIYSLIKTLALKAGSTIYSFHISEDKKGVAMEIIKNLLPDLLEKIKLIKADMRKIYSSPTSSDLRMTDDLRGMTSFLKKLNKLLNSSCDTITRSAKPRMRKATQLWIENLQNELDFLISFLEKTEKQGIEIAELKALETSIMNMANEAKCVTEHRFLSYYPTWYCMLKFSDVMEEVKLIKKEMERINEKFFGEMLSSQDTNEVIVGFEDEAQRIIERLIGGPKLNVTSIVGMGGLGKTTLARKLYNHPSVVHYFHVRAWCCISQVFEERSVLIDILHQVDDLPGQMYQMNDLADLKGMLRKCLKGRRYLIVVDDIWDIEAWTVIRGCFDDDCKGSRIIFTTRLKEVALKVQACCSISIDLRFFNDIESQELLKRKLFPRGRCPPKRVEIVEQIAKNCKGLPLVVVLVAGILSKKKEEEWEQVAENLSRETDGDLLSLSKKILELSYNSLPYYLRPCFLYLGAFPEDKEILAKKLMWLWVAEGFIQKHEQKSLEEVAKGYIMELIGRNLVMVAERGSNRGVKTLRIHDLLRGLSLAKAKEEKFLRLLEANGEHFAPTFEQYRLCIYYMPDDNCNWPSRLNICSLLYFAPAFHLDVASSSSVSLILSYKFLNVLDLGRLVLEGFDREMESLVHLRLLAVRIRGNSIPSSVANLGNLTTFLVRGTRGEIAVPKTIWSMKGLRHLHIDNRASSIWDNRDVKNAILDQLETLSTPILQCDSHSRDLACSLPNLRKLKCIFTASWNDVENCNDFPNLGYFRQLESIKVFYYATDKSHGRFSFPLNLKKLTLSKFRLPWSDITAIGKALPNLEVLKLLSRAFDGKQWETREGEFPNLKYLKLEGLNIEELDVPSKDHFPLLEKLVVHRCKQIEEIPSSVGDIDTLQMIEVKWCNNSIGNSAKAIYVEQKEEYGKELKLIIHPSPSDQGSTLSS